MMDKFIFATKWKKDFYMLRIWKIAFLWITNAEHTNRNRFFEIWRAKKSRALIFGSYGIGVMIFI